VRDTKALDNFLRQTAIRTEELQAQVERLIRMDLNGGNSVPGVAYELGKARGISRSINAFLDKAKLELDKIGGAK
jgi:hypothetical protein